MATETHDPQASPVKAPFPWFGGKSRVAGLVWERFGADVPNYVEPFFGSGAVLLGRPGDAGKTETANDKDGFVTNFWRAVAADPEQTARYADSPVNENDLHARHVWLRERRDALVPRLEGDPDYFDAQIAGWWAWGICCWIGGGWCGPSDEGPWGIVEDEEGCRQLVKADGVRGVSRRRIHLSNAGRGVHRTRIHLGSMGVHRKSIHETPEGLHIWFSALSQRLRKVRVCCGDWKRVCGPTPTFLQGTTAVFLDPPYSHAERSGGLYAEDDADIAAEVREWCLENGANPLLRIALCGYEGEHEALEREGWDIVAWKAHGGYGSQGAGRGRANAGRERIWFSPACLGGEPRSNGNNPYWLSLRDLPVLLPQSEKLTSF